MGKGSYIGTFVILLIFVIGAVAYYKTSDAPSEETNPDAPNEETSSCEELAKALDAKTGVLVTGQSEIVGGTLINVSLPYFYVAEDEEQGKYTYTLTFKGVEKERVLNLRANADQPFGYKIGQFYRFDLINTRISGQLSGSYFDLNMTQLQPIDCPQ